MSAVLSKTLKDKGMDRIFTEVKHSESLGLSSPEQLRLYHLLIRDSKFYRDDDSLLYWYIDIVEFTTGSDKTELIVTDLLADVIISPTGRIKVVDLDELAEALEKGLITQEQTINCMKQLNDLLTLIYRDKFDTLTEPLDSRGL